MSDNQKENKSFSGLTARDYFAAKAIQGLLADNGRDYVDKETLASWCYKMADVMLEERKQKRQR